MVCPDNEEMLHKIPLHVRQAIATEERERIATQVWRYLTSKPVSGKGEVTVSVDELVELIEGA